MGCEKGRGGRVTPEVWPQRRGEAAGAGLTGSQGSTWLWAPWGMRHTAR